MLAANFDVRFVPFPQRDAFLLSVPLVIGVLQKIAYGWLLSIDLGERKMRDPEQCSDEKLADIVWDAELLGCFGSRIAD